MVAYLGALANDRRLHPRDPETDVLTRLIQGEHGRADEVERLTETELMHQCIFLLNAGHETTTNLIGNALHALTEWPDEKARLIANAGDPAIVKSAVEEFLRFESSNQLGNRITTCATKVGGVTEFRRVAALAAARGVKLAPHSPYFGPGALATLHLLAALSAQARFEYFYLWPEAMLYADALTPKRGDLTVPLAPGLGADPDPEMVRRYRVD